MARKKRLIDKPEKKELDELAAQTSSGDSYSVNNNSITKSSENQVLSDDGKEDTQLYNPAGNYKQPEDDKTKSKHWIFLVYEESAPKDWKTNLINTGISFTISEWHEFDVESDGSPKKKHLHGIISYEHAVTYNTAKRIREITKGPFPLKCRSVSGSYAYFTHRWNPEKHQYPGKGIERHNGWEKPLEPNEISYIRGNIIDMCLMEDIKEFGELVIWAKSMGSDYEQVVSKNSFYFERFVKSYHYAPIRVLARFCSTLEDDDDKRKVIEKRISDLLDSNESGNQFGCHYDCY